MIELECRHSDILIQDASSMKENRTNRNVSDYLNIFKNISRHYKPEFFQYISKPRLYGIKYKHLYQCGRTGGTIELGEFAYRYCFCHLCRQMTDDLNMILCDGCNNGFHIYCLKPPLSHIPDDDWYCPNCKPKPQKVPKFMQTQISQFFGISKKQKTKFEKIKNNKKLPVREGRQVLRVHAENPDPNATYMTLGQVFVERKMEYIDDLKYEGGTEKINCASNDLCGEMQVCYFYMFSLYQL